MFYTSCITHTHTHTQKLTLEDIDMSALSRFGVNEARLACSSVTGLLLCSIIFKNLANETIKQTTNI